MLQRVFIWYFSSLLAWRWLFLPYSYSRASHSEEYEPNLHSLLLFAVLQWSCKNLNVFWAALAELVLLCLAGRSITDF